MAQTSTFGPEDRIPPTGSASETAEFRGSAEWYAKKFGTANSEDEIGADERHAGPDNNGIDPVNAAGTIHEVSEEEDGGMLPVSAPAETIDETSPVNKDEKKYAKAAAKNADALPADAGEHDPSLDVTDETIDVVDTDTEGATPAAGQDESTLPPTEHETGDEQQVEIPADTDQLQADSNALEGSEEETEEQDETTTPEDEPEWDKPYPQGNPVNAWKVDEIDAWAADQDPAVVFPDGATKKQKLTQINGGD